MRRLDAGTGILPDCMDCIAWLERPGMVEAAHSVAMDTPYTGAALLLRAVERFHQSRHREAP